MDNSESPLRTIFADALEIEDSQARAAYLVRACGMDTKLRLEVEELIKAQAQAGRFLPHRPNANDAQLVMLQGAEALAPAGNRSQVPLTEKPGDLIGRYKLLQKIGEGGCGVVYMAEQEEPIRRKVALKVIKLGMDTKNVVARFEAERQALAMMDHLNIAKVLDAGATETGRPFFVMELVRGTRITQYCDQHKLSTRDRLELFIQVCQAVQHAHQKGIIHRDLKPSNILVMVNDGVAVPKVIDFGIAKATEGRLTDKTLFTAFEQFLGTPAYMSPEQAAMTSLDIDTRSDIYSLGVLLYELLTSKTPFDARELAAAGLDELRRTIREKEPSRPSTRLGTMPDGELTTTARQRGIEAPKLIQVLRGDLDWIVMRCLEKDRARRYETANGLARDIQRHLDNEVVLARPPSTAYRFQRVLRRNKLFFAAGLAVALALLAGTGISTWQAVRAGRDRQRVQRNIVRQYVANGTRLMNDGDMFASLLWYTEALRLDSGDARREEPHRVRIASVLRQCPKLINVFSHGTMLYHAEFSPDGTKVVTASNDHTARVWDATTGQQQLALPHDGEVYDASFSRDSRKIVTSSRDKNARIWDSRTGKLLKSLGHPDTVWQARFSGDGRLVATACQDGTAQLWDVETGTRVNQPGKQASRVKWVMFSSDGHLFVSIDEGGIACFWDVTTGQKLFQCSDDARRAHDIFSPDSRHFLTSEGFSLHVRDAISFKDLPFSPLPDEGGRITASFSPDGRFILGTSESEHTTQVWDAATGKPLFSPPIRHSDYLLDLSFGPDSRLFATAGEDNTAQVWSSLTGKALSPPLKHILMVKEIQFASDSRRLIGNSCDQVVRTWDLAITGELDSGQIPQFEPAQLLSSDRTRRLELDASNNVRVVEVVSGNSLAVLPHDDPVVYTTLSRDGGTVLTASQADNAVSSMPSRIFLWDARTGRRLNSRPMPGGFLIQCAAFSPDGSKVVTGDQDYSARLWDARTGVLLSQPMRHGHRVSWVGFSTDGRTLATACWDRTVRVWDAWTGKPLTPPLRHNARVRGAFWSADGERLNTVTEDDQLQVWALADGEPLTPSRKLWNRESVEPRSVALPWEQTSGGLPRDDRPVGDLVQLAQMLAVGQIDASGNMVPMHVPEMTSAWELLHKRYPDQFRATTPEAVAWHRGEAQTSESEGDLVGSLFHVQQAVMLRPRDSVLAQRQAELAAAIAAGLTNAQLPASIPGHVLPRDPGAGADEIDLSAHYNLGLIDSLDQKPNGNNFADLASGLQKFGGVRFDMRGLIHLDSQSAKREGKVYPESAKGILVERKCRLLHFLQAASGSAEDGTRIGIYVLHYGDGQQRELPIEYGRDIDDWWFSAAVPGSSHPSGAVVGWMGHNRLADHSNNAIRFFNSTRENPRPDVKLVSIDFISTMSPASPFLVALTVE